VGIDSDDVADYEQAVTASDSEGEQHVAEYLEQWGVSYEREPDVGGRNPDFVVDLQGSRVALEVYEPALRLTNRVGSFDSVGKLQNAFRGRKGKQRSAAKDAGVPYVVVIGSGKSSIVYDHFAVMGAMFGRIGVSWNLDTVTGRPVSDPRPAHLGGARVQPGMNTGISAVALLRRFNPTLRRLQDAWDADRAERSPAFSESTFQDRVRFLERSQAIQDELERRGEFDPRIRLSRLIFYRNPWAVHQLPESFGGPYDDHFGVLEVLDSETFYGPVAEGCLRRRVPR